MVTFNSSTLSYQNGEYTYTMQRGDSLYAIAAKLAKERGGNATTICNELIQKNSFTTKTDDVSKTHVNKIQVGAKINLGSQFATALTKYFEGSSGVATQNQARRFASSSAISPEIQEIEMDPVYILARRSSDHDLADLSSLMPSDIQIASAAEDEGFTIENDGERGKTTDPSLAAQVLTRGLLGLVTQPEVKKQIADLVAGSATTTSNAPPVAQSASAFSRLSPEAVSDNAQDVIPSREDSAKTDDAGWTPDGTLEPELSAADRETLRQLREARGVEDPIDYDPLTGLNMTAYMNAYTDSERSELRKNLPYSLQELRAADRMEDLGTFDRKQFGAVSYGGFYVLLPFGLNGQESNDLADFLISHHRQNHPITTNRAFRAVTQAVASKREGMKGIMQAPLSPEAEALAQNSGPANQHRRSFEITDAEYDELFGLDSDEKNNAMALNDIKK